MSWYVILEWNQASGQPELPYFGRLHDQLADAIDEAEDLEAKARERGRRESYTVHEVDPTDARAES